jgi:hypothetical protein
LQPTKNDSSFFSVIKQIGKSRVLCSHAWSYWYCTATRLHQ